MNILTNLYNSGPDAYKNLFLAKFSFNGNKNKEFLDSLSVRCSEFTPPTYEQKEYTVKYMNVSIPKPAPKIGVTRNFSLTFRLDESYDIYKNLLEIQKSTFDFVNNITKVDINTLEKENKLMTVEVFAVKGDMTDESSKKDMNTELLFKYGKCWIDNIKLSDYNHNGTEPMTVTVSVNYITVTTE